MGKFVACPTLSVRQCLNPPQRNLCSFRARRGSARREPYCARRDTYGKWSASFAPPATFLVENKDRSIFRKNIGRALLNRDRDSFLPTWELDRTSRPARDKHAIDLARQSAIEALVSQHIRERFTFIVFRIDDKSQRLALESKLISTVSRCENCQPSTHWLGPLLAKRQDSDGRSLARQ
jgi:hypothetical protein